MVWPARNVLATIGPGVVLTRPGPHTIVPPGAGSQLVGAGDTDAQSTVIWGFTVSVTVVPVASWSPWFDTLSV